MQIQLYLKYLHTDILFHFQTLAPFYFSSANSFFSRHGTSRSFSTKFHLVPEVYTRHCSLISLRVSVTSICSSDYYSMSWACCPHPYHQEKHSAFKLLNVLHSSRYKAFTHFSTFLSCQSLPRLVSSSMGDFLQILSFFACKHALPFQHAKRIMPSGVGFLSVFETITLLCSTNWSDSSHSCLLDAGSIGYATKPRSTWLF